MSTAPAPYVRYEARTPQGEAMLAAYARAVERMKDRPADQPTSWAYQAAMHGARRDDPRRLANGCKHLSWFFVSWHRMFVYYFEQIARAAVIESNGPSDWGLPYWNYALGGEHARMPEAFRNPAVNGAVNPLYVEQRDPRINAGAGLKQEIISPDAALNRHQFTGLVEFGGVEGPPGPQFWSQPGALEKTPHNDVHGAVGGRGWMSYPDQAAQDPIFWLHHANIDRVWALWNEEGNLNPSNPAWTAASFEFFDASGTVVAKACGDVLDTVKDLGYTYDKLERDPTQATARAVAPAATLASAEESRSDMPPPAPQEPEIVGASEKPVRLVGVAEHVPVRIDTQARREALARTSAVEPQRILLHLDDIEAKGNPGTVYAIYVNAPDGANERERAAHHAGNLSLFGIEHFNQPPHDEHPHGLRISLDITELAQQLRTEGNWNDEHLDVALLPVDLIPPPGASPSEAVSSAPKHEDMPVTIGRISISYA
jgi:tyrosinase